MALTFTPSTFPFTTTTNLPGPSYYCLDADKSIKQKRSILIFLLSSFRNRYKLLQSRRFVLLCKRLRLRTHCIIVSSCYGTYSVPCRSSRKLCIPAAQASLHLPCEIVLLACETQNRTVQPNTFIFSHLQPDPGCLVPYWKGVLCTARFTATPGYASLGYYFMQISQS